MSDGIEYRHWRLGDDDGVMRILGPMGWCTPERYAAKFDDPGLKPADVLVAIRDGRIVSHLMLPHRRVRFGQATLPFGGIGQVVVDEAARGLGIGSSLLRRGLAHHRASGDVLAGLFTFRTLLPAYPMYQRHGFVTIAEHRRLTVPRAALPVADGFTTRLAQPDDRPAIARLLEAWAAEHAGVSVEAADAPLTGQRLVIRSDGAVVGRLAIVDRGDGRVVGGGLLTAPDTSVLTVLAAGLADEAVAAMPVVANRENRVYAELTAWAVRTGLDLDEESVGAVLMFACLDRQRALAGLATELAGRLRQAGVEPLRVTLAPTGEEAGVGLDWDGRVLALTDADPVAPHLTLSAAALVKGLAGQPEPPPAPPLDRFWAALFPPGRVEMRLVDCW